MSSKVHVLSAVESWLLFVVVIFCPPISSVDRGCPSSCIFINNGLNITLHIFGTKTMISNNLSLSLFWSFYITAPESSTLQGSWMRQKRNCFLRTKSTWKYANIWTPHVLLLVSRAASDLSLFLQGQNAALTEKHCFYTPQGKYLQVSLSLSRSTY